MTGCCPPHRYERVFSAGQAKREAARFRKKGLRWAPRRTLELYRDGGIDGRTLLEIGGGIGDLQVELLQAGVERVASVELSDGYEAAAANLLRTRGLADRSTRLIGDFTAQAHLVEAADIVVLHSVVCCYADAPALLHAAAAKARRHLVLSYPRSTWWLRASTPMQNLYPLLRGSDFRFVIHPPARILGLIEEAGFRVAHTERNWVDHLAVATRPGLAP